MQFDGIVIHDLAGRWLSLFGQVYANEFEFSSTEALLGWLGRGGAQVDLVHDLRRFGGATAAGVKQNHCAAMFYTVIIKVGIFFGRAQANEKAQQAANKRPAERAAKGDQSPGSLLRGGDKWLKAGKEQKADAGGCSQQAAPNRPAHHARQDGFLSHSVIIPVLAGKIVCLAEVDCFNGVLREIVLFQGGYGRCRIPL